MYVNIIIDIHVYTYCSSGKKTPPLPDHPIFFLCVWVNSVSKLSPATNFENATKPTPQRARTSRVSNKGPPNVFSNPSGFAPSLVPPSHLSSEKDSWKESLALTTL